MRSLKILLIFLLTLPSIFVLAQDKLAVVKSEKEKAARPEKLFAIYERGSRISKADIRKDTKTTTNIIQIETVNITGGSVVLSRATAADPVLPPAEITSFAVLNGSYGTSREVSRSGRSVIVQYLDVAYPFRARITVSEQPFEFEIKEKGSWKVIVGVSL